MKLVCFEGETNVAVSITTIPLLSELKKILSHHRCTIQEQQGGCIITFPEGTTRTEIYFRTLSERYRITLPDGLELREVRERHLEKSILYIVLDKKTDSTSL